MDVTVVDWGVGNTASVMFGLDRIGAKATLTSDLAAIADAPRLILPGDGAAAFAMERIGVLKLGDIIKKFPRPLLGICVGQQLLYESSEEGDTKCLGLIPGRVYRMSTAPDRPVPHMGWNQLAVERDDPLLDGVPNGGFVYFVHSYACPRGAATLASTDYGGPFSAVVRAGNVWGCQFHPERSAAVGQRILENFLALPC